MSFQKPSIPKGTRDFSPIEMVRRNYIFDTIREVFELYGYQPIETPAMENLSTLLGKYGEEGDKLLFKILNSGDFLDKSNNSGALSTNFRELLPLITEKGLRYDLTVPFARFVVQNKNDLIFPFKRYQIQPVWRADRPQKGRYREFFQCDVDVIGSDSLLNEVELIQIVETVFQNLRIGVIVKINNRKILAAIAEFIGEPDKLTDFTVTIDKIEKIGLDEACNELRQRGFSESSIEKSKPFLNFASEKDFETSFPFFYSKLNHLEKGVTGLAEIKKLFTYFKSVLKDMEIHFDISLARGLNYYTGAIIEVKSKDVQIGSICGGGRYDDLTGIFGLPGVSGVGISFGADRIYDVMNELSLFPTGLLSTTKVLFTNFGNEEENYCLSLLSALRNKGIHAEIYPDHSKLKKQMEYANKKNIPYVVLVGKDEMVKGHLTVKNMLTGEQFVMNEEDLITFLS
ncbi:MAG: histidine--tRNA ligase [Bacteroidetes bacterium]|nr:histidine--tRNA ligase [Bacteroidota bacterium]